MPSHRLAQHAGSEPRLRRGHPLGTARRACRAGRGESPTAQWCPDQAVEGGRHDTGVHV